MPFGKVFVAIANKHARQICAMLVRNVDYGPLVCLNQPMQWNNQAEDAAHAAWQQGCVST
jgi:transposase